MGEVTDRRSSVDGSRPCEGEVSARAREVPDEAARQGSAPQGDGTWWRSSRGTATVGTNEDPPRTRQSPLILAAFRP